MFKKNKLFEVLVAPDCFKCVFFKVSWDVNFPRLCTQFGFKGKTLPSKTVFETTGRHCPCFIKKTNRLKNPVKGKEDK